MRRFAALGLAVALCGARCTVRAQDVTRTGALVSVSVVPETVTVGQPFSVRIRVRAPKFAVVHFPAVPDTADAIEAVDPRAMEDAGDVELIDRTAVYRLVAWDVGKRTPHFANVTVNTAGTDQVYPVAIPSVNVTSLLPADSAQRVPKEARDPVALPSALWKWLLIGVVFAGLIWLLWRRRKRRAAEVPREPEPFVAAVASFDALDALALPAAGEPGRHVIASIDILRAYLARRFPDMRDSLTAEEIARALPTSDLPVLPDRLSNILDRETSLRFAHAAVSTDEALALGTEARAIVRDIQSAHEARVRAMERGPAAGAQAMNRFLAFDFGEPMWLALLVLPVLWLWWRRRRQPGAIVFSRVDVLVRGPSLGRWTARILLASRIIALVLGCVALARPRTGARVEQVSADGISIIMTIDLSSSMLAEDFQPQNRVEVAKDKMKQFIAGRTQDQIGLVSFSGEALTQVPLTMDYPVLLAAVDNLQPGQLEDGTAIGTAIATSVNRLQDATGRSKVIILLTDGVNNRGTIDPRTAAKAAAALGVRVYTIGIGTEGMAPVPVGRGVFGLRYETRAVELDEPLLEFIASTTGGRYFRAKDGQALQHIYSQIDALERSPIHAKRYVRYHELYRWPLGVALAALLLELPLLALRGPLP